MEEDAEVDSSCRSSAATDPPDIDPLDPVKTERQSRVLIDDAVDVVIKCADVVDDAIHLQVRAFQTLTELRNSRF